MNEVAQYRMRGPQVNCFAKRGDCPILGRHQRNPPAATARRSVKTRLSTETVDISATTAKHRILLCQQEDFTLRYARHGHGTDGIA